MISIFHDPDQGNVVAPNFKAYEFECPHCFYAVIDHRLLSVLPKIRKFIGAPIYITSGYRCPKHNTDIGGAVESRHIGGMAVDFTFGHFEHFKDTVHFSSFEIFCQEIGVMGFGVHYENKFIHVDVDDTRNQFTSWTYTKDER